MSEEIQIELSKLSKAEIAELVQTTFDLGSLLLRGTNFDLILPEAATQISALKTKRDLLIEKAKI